MRRDIEFKMKNEDGIRYEIRVKPFGGKFKFQFKEKGSDIWDYERKPSSEELEAFLDIIERRYQRRRSSYEDVQLAQQMLSECRHKENS